MTKQAKVPSLRFPEFHGEWEEKMLGEIFNISAGGDISQRNVNTEKDDKFCYPVYANSIENRGLYGYSDLYKIEGLSITVAGRGINFGIAIPREEKYYPIVRLLVLIPKYNDSIHFCSYSINSINFFCESTGVPQLTSPQLSSYKISLPTLPEQRKIAGFLSSVDSRIQMLTEKKELLEQYKKGMMQKLFSQEIRFKDDNGNDYPNWDEKRLGEVAEVTTGNKDTKDKVNNGLYPFIVRSDNVERINSYSYDGEAVLTSGDGVGVGKNFHYMTGKFNFHQRVYCINKFKNELIGKFFYLYFSKSFYQRVIRLSAKNSVDSVRRDMVTKMPIPLPSRPEQQKIADFLSAIDTKIELVNTQIEQSKEYKRGLLQKLLISNSPRIT
jgi:type I restriction enzyme S subunit